jgi:hypothetical protein
VEPDEKPEQTTHGQAPPKETSPSDIKQKIWQALENATQDVRQTVKKEREAELISGDVLNFRMKA